MYKISALLTLLLLFFFISSCSPKEPKNNNILTIAIESNPTNLDPRFSTDAVSAKITTLIFNGLLKRDETMRLIPDLAEDWEMRDGFTYIFRLKKGIKFHDGREITSKDVKYTYEFILDPVNKSPKKGGYDRIKEIKVSDDYTVIFILKEPFAPFLDNMTLGIVPEHAAREKGKDFSSHPIGTGPFIFKEWKQDERVMLTANNNYFEGRPAIDGVIYRIIPDETIRVLELEKGNIHLLMNPITSDILPRFERNLELKVIKKIGTNYSYIGFNLNDPVLKNLKVRQAIAHAIDRDGICKHILKGLAKKSDGILTEYNWAYEPDLRKYEYNPELSKKLLDEAGYPPLTPTLSPKGRGGIRFKITFKTSQNEIRKRIAEVFQEQLRKVGIEMEIMTYEWGTFFSDIKSGNFQIFSLTWVGISDPDIFHYMFHSSSFPPDGANRIRYSNPEIDSLLEHGRKTLQQEERKEIYGKIQKIISDELPYINLWHSVNVAIMKKNVEGFVLYPDEDMASLKNVIIQK
ncbi:MAG: ABC transporter substrate-binding protein [Nitrospirae bacterium]|nr:ABC transporter substrate-binding protein [Nitrospirota bacterium]